MHTKIYCNISKTPLYDFHRIKAVFTFKKHGQITLVSPLFDICLSNDSITSLDKRVFSFTQAVLSESFMFDITIDNIISQLNRDKPFTQSNVELDVIFLEAGVSEKMIELYQNVHIFKSVSKSIDNSVVNMARGLEAEHNFAEMKRVLTEGKSANELTTSELESDLDYMKYAFLQEKINPANIHSAFFGSNIIGVLKFSDLLVHYGIFDGMNKSKDLFAILRGLLNFDNGMKRVRTSFQQNLEVSRSELYRAISDGLAIQEEV